MKLLSKKQNLIFIILLFIFKNPLFCQVGADTAQIIYDLKHYSKYFKEERNYRIFLPPNYYINKVKVYPVIYFFHGFGGRFNGPYGTDPNGNMESRYYDSWTGNAYLCGSDSLDNIKHFVKCHNVIVVKWDGYVNPQYPRPYDIGPVKNDLQFVDYFPEFVEYIDAHFRTIPNRSGRAVSGLSMGGFMSMFVSAKYPHLISSASFFNPSAAFTIGNKTTQIYTAFKDMGINYIGLPIRMHLGLKDFLRQYNLELDASFKQLELSYESWDYGVNYFNGFHTVVNVNDQFDFHMKYFNYPPDKPEKWHHIDVYPNFNIWNYSVTSDRAKSGYCILEDVQKAGFKISTRKWLPDGPFYNDITTNILTDSIYEPLTQYHVDILNIDNQTICNQLIVCDSQGRLNISVASGHCDVGIYKTGDQGKISVSEYILSKELPAAWEDVTLTPIIYNKGGLTANAELELISNDDNLEVLTAKKTITSITKGEFNKSTSFKIRFRNSSIDRGRIKILLTSNGKTECFLCDIPFCYSESELTDYVISDGRRFAQEVEGATLFGQGNHDGNADPGEKISILTKSDFVNNFYYGLRLYTDDPYIDKNQTTLKYSSRNDWSGAMRETSEIYIKSDCPKGHIINLYGTYDYPLPGNISRDKQGAQSFVHEIKRVSLKIIVGD